MSRVSQAELVRLVSELSPRRWELLRAVSELRLVSGGQLRRRFYPGAGASAGRLARRDLAALHECGALHRLQRRIGGVRAGSTGFVFAIGSVGRRLLELERGEGLPGGRSHYEPTLGFVEHALAVSEIWVGLHEYLRDPWTGDRWTTFDFHVERAAWRQYLDPLGALTTLKPDAEVEVRGREFSEHLWLEVDRATERRSTLRRKLAAYISYFHTGHEQQRGVFPLTVWLTTSEARAAVLREVIREFAPTDRRLFRVGLLSAAPPLLLSAGRSES